MALVSGTSEWDCPLHWEQRYSMSFGTFCPKCQLVHPMQLLWQQILSTPTKFSRLWYWPQESVCCRTASADGRERAGEGEVKQGGWKLKKSRVLSRGGRHCRDSSALALDCYMWWRRFSFFTFFFCGVVRGLCCDPWWAALSGYTQRLAYVQKLFCSLDKSWQLNKSNSIFALQCKYSGWKLGWCQFYVHLALNRLHGCVMMLAALGWEYEFVCSVRHPVALRWWMCGSFVLRGLQRVELVSLGHWITGKTMKTLMLFQKGHLFASCSGEPAHTLNLWSEVRMLPCSVGGTLISKKQGVCSLLSRSSEFHT